MTKLCPTSSNVYSMSHNTQEGGGRHEYELGALNQSQPELIAIADSLHSSLVPMLYQELVLKLKSPHISKLLGTRHT